FFALADFNDTDCEVIGLDWNMEINESKFKVPDKILQGNLDPCLLYAPREVIKSETRKMIQTFNGRHIANLGHGVYPDTPLDGVKCFIETVQHFTYNEKNA
ncbi:MAG: uroporphyrinogen decarboxylase family protein, partial [Chitinophagales bacterium]